MHGQITEKARSPCKKTGDEIRTCAKKQSANKKQLQDLLQQLKGVLKLEDASAEDVLEATMLFFRYNGQTCRGRVNSL